MPSLQREVPVVDRTHGPSHDEPRKQIEDRRQIQLPALADHELGGVADPAPIRRVGRELSVEQIRRDRLIVITHRRALEAFPSPRFQSVFLHQSNHALAAHADSCSCKSSWIRGLPYRCLLASNDARTNTRSRRSRWACADSARRDQA
jgi:hypothetical protein